MAIKIDANDLAKTVNGILDKFGQNAEKCLAQAVWDTAGDTVKELKKGGAYQGGENYNKGWTRELTRKRLYAEAKIFNKNAPGLAHLLEFGHLMRNGRRTRAFPHIAPVNDRIPEMFEKNFADLVAEELIKNI